MDDFHFTRNGTGSGSSTGSSSGSFKPATGKPDFSEATQSSFEDLQDSFEEAEDDIPF
jgi:hypothetical protein